MREDESSFMYEKGVKNLYDTGIQHVPNKYILPINERPFYFSSTHKTPSDDHIQMPVIDFAQLQGPNRVKVLHSLAYACEKYGVFQLVNHGIAEELIAQMVDVSRRFFEMPLADREKYMSNDIKAPVRYGTSFNQKNDGVFCWRDFLKLVSHPLPEVLHHWPSSPHDFRRSGVAYATETRRLFVKLMEAVLESLGLEKDDVNNEDFESGSHLMVVNCYPPCPEPELTLGMPPHSDYGLLTLLLQDEVKGLQILHQDNWVTILPVPVSFVVNVGDHLEIFSNGRYKSVLHRVLVNSNKHRISVASLHSFPFTMTVRPVARLVTDANPRRYKDTDFPTYLRYLSSCDSKRKNFLESQKILT